MQIAAAMTSMASDPEPEVAIFATIEKVLGRTHVSVRTQLLLFPVGVHWHLRAFPEDNPENSIQLDSCISLGTHICLL